MRPTWPSRSSSGFTMAELMVGMFLIMLMMGSLLAIISAGARYFNNSTKVVELQQSCLMSANQVGAELAEGNLACVLEDHGTGNSFVTFASPRDLAGTVSFNTAPGETGLLWQTYICFFVDTTNGEKLKRQVALVNPPVPEPPQIPSAYVGSYFQNLMVPSPPRLVAQNIYHLEVNRTTTISIVVGARDPSHEFRVSVKTQMSPRN